MVIHLQPCKNHVADYCTERVKIRCMPVLRLFYALAPILGISKKNSDKQKKKKVSLEKVTRY